MALTLFAHPFSSYCQKAIIALYENAIAFDLALVEPGAPAADELARLWPLRRFPVLRDGERVVPEATAIIEYLAVHHPGPVTLIPADPDAALETRLLDRIFDNYVLSTVGAIVGEALRPAGQRDPTGAEKQRVVLDEIYPWLDQRLAGRVWAGGDTFTLADCAAAPALLYADWTHPIPPALASLHAYRRRLIERPSYARALDEARPYRHFFPLGAPVGRD